MLSGNDEQSRINRRTIARWTNLHLVLLWREVCLKVKKRFPKDHHLVDSGLMTAEEYDVFESASSSHGRWFVPISWIGHLLRKLRDEGKFSGRCFEVRNNFIPLGTCRETDRFLLEYERNI